MSQTCTICGKPFTTKRRKGLYCSPACSQKAYRRRKNAERQKRAEQRRRSEVEQHRDEWIRFLISSGSLSRKQAERVFVALTSIDRLQGLPFDQLEAFPDPGN